MTDTIKVDTPDATNENQEKTVAERKSDLLEERRKRLLAEDEPESSESETEEEEVDTPDSEVETEEEDDGESDVPSQADEIDIDSLTEDDIREIAKLKGVDLDPKADKAWAAQRRKVKELEAELEATRAAKDEALSVRTNGDAEAQVTRAEANIEYWNDKLILDGDTQYDEATGQDIKGVTHDGKFYPAKAVLEFLKAEKAKLPDLRKAASEAVKARESLGNIDDVIEDVKTKYGLDEKASEAYDKLLSNPKFEVLKGLIPEFGIELVDIFGQAALQQSGSAKKKVVLKRKSPKESKDSISPAGGSATPSDGRGNSSQVKKLQKIVSDPTRSVKDRMAASKSLRLLKYN